MQARPREPGLTWRISGTKGAVPPGPAVPLSSPTPTPQSTGLFTETSNLLGKGLGKLEEVLMMLSTAKASNK